MIRKKQLISSNLPLVDLVANSKKIRQEVLERFSDIIGSARYIIGKEVHDFEELFARYCQTSHCVGVANGTEALHMALRAIDVGPGDEVITAANSFAATAFAISYTGATPVFIDVCEDDFNIDPMLIEKAITSRTKAIVPVHLYGQPAKMDTISRIAKKHNLKIVEDAAQAHGAEFSGARCGSMGEVGCFSFYPGKNLGAFGDAGAIVTDQPEISERISLLRNYGQRVKNRHDELAFNCRLDTIQAAVLLTKMKYIEVWTEARRQAADRYRDELADTDLILPIEKTDCRHVYHLFVVRHPDRDRVIQEMKDKGISCGIHYPNPLPTAGPYQSKYDLEQFPVTTKLSKEIFSLPMYPELTGQDVLTVCDALKSCI